MGGGGRFAGCIEFLLALIGPGQGRAAFQIVFSTADLAEPGPDDIDMGGSPIMARTSQCHLRASQTDGPGGAGFYQRQGLDGFDAGAREDRAQHIADGQFNLPVGIDDGDRSAMAAFYHVAANDIHQDRIYRRRLPSLIRGMIMPILFRVFVTVVGHG